MADIEKRTEITIDFSGVIELAVFLTVVLAVCRLLKIWTFSWWWVASPILALIGLVIVGLIVVYAVLVVKGLAERQQ